MLFYGLSQAGRAVAAASTSVDDNHYRLVKDGIQTHNEGDTELHRVTVINQGMGSFTQLAPLLQSGTLSQDTPLGQIWATIPDLRVSPLPVANAEYFPVLECRNEDQRALISGLPSRLAESAIDQEISDFLSAYPTLAGMSPRLPVTRRFDSACVYCWWSMPASRDELAPFTWRENDRQIQLIVIDRFTRPYRGDNERYVFPAVGGDGRPLHPLLGWWALLFTLSMLARYEPARWTSHLERDKSPYAVPIETALDRALDTCPELIAHAINAVALQ